MARIQGAVGVLLSVCLLVSACGEAPRPISPSESQAEPLPLSQAGEPEPLPEGSVPSSRAEPAPAPSEAEPPSQAEPLPDSPPAPPVPEETAGGASAASQPEEPAPPPEEIPEAPAPELEPEPPPLSSPPEEAPDPPEKEDPSPEYRWLNITEASVMAFINQERGKRGLTPLTLDQDLTAAARVRAEELYQGNYVSHTRPGGRPWETVLEECGVEYARAAENLAWCNHEVGEEIPAFQWFTLWKDSPSHYEAMMDEKYTCCGVAILTGPYYDGEDQSYAVALFCTY